MATLWQRLLDWWRWEPQGFRATGLGEIMREPSTPKPKKTPAKTPKPRKTTTGFLRGRKPKTSKPRSPSKRG